MAIELNILNFAFVPLSDEGVSDDDINADPGDDEDLVGDKDGVPGEDESEKGDDGSLESE